MKRLKYMIVPIMIIALVGLISCGTDIDENSGRGAMARGDKASAPTAAIPSEKTTVPADTLRIYYKNTQAAFMHIWNDTGTPLKNTPPEWGAVASWAKFTWKDGDFVVADVPLATSATGAIGFIPMKTEAGVDSNKLTSDVKYTLEAGHDTIYVNSSGTVISYDKDNLFGILNGEVTTANGKTIKLTTADIPTTVAKADFAITDKSGTSITDFSISGSGSSVTITITGSVTLSSAPYAITYSGKTTYAAVASSLIEENFDATAVEDFGVKIIDANTANFKMWAPTASAVKLYLYKNVTDCGGKINDGYESWKTGKEPKDPNATTPPTPAPSPRAGTTIAPTEKNDVGVVDMTAGDRGVWSAENVTTTGYKYYKYAITTNGKEHVIADIWSHAAAPDSTASEIIDINSSTDAKPTSSTKTYGTSVGYENPFGNKTDTKKYSDAVIYEMHVRDWSGSDYDAGGRFTSLSSSDNIAHLKDLGVTHVQILPIFDYAQVRADEKYNWGYNPYHYNVPESRYSAASDGEGVVKDMRTMIEKLHAEGIAVIMDVVYNHTSGTSEGSLYDMTVPKFFYRIKSDGYYYNGSGCGNEIATNHKMVKKYVIESLKHWMLDYHINGFRFDLMGVAEASTMKEIYDELYKIDKNVLVYGEPWTGGESGVTGGAVKSGSGTSGYGYGAFNDDFRDGIKGGEFGGFHRGLVNGNISDTRVLNGLLGKSGDNNRNGTSIPGLVISYAECHDNYTLFDKLLYSKTTEDIEGQDNIVSKFSTLWTNKGQYIEDIKKEEKLAAAFILLGQGTPFLNGGQEFLRSKQGNPDSYAADTKGGHAWTEAEIKTCNLVDLNLKKTYSDVYATYRGLIAFRKANLASFSGNTSATTTLVKEGVVQYDAGDYKVYFNANDTLKSIPSTTGKVVSVPGVKFTGFNSLIAHNASVSHEDKFNVGANNVTVTTIPAKSFLIMKVR